MSKKLTKIVDEILGAIECEGDDYFFLECESDNYLNKLMDIAREELGNRDPKVSALSNVLRSFSGTRKMYKRDKYNLLALLEHWESKNE